MNSESYINRRVSIKLQIGFVRGGVSLNFKVWLASLRMEWAQRSLEEKAGVGGCHSCFEGCV
jgi:hypothetical protein